MTPQFHESFWVVAGTAAPIIGLAGVVAIGDSYGALPVFRQARLHGSPAIRTAASKGLRATTWIYLISGMNVGYQGLVLALSLQALLLRRDTNVTIMAAVLPPVGILALIVVAILTNTTRNAQRTLAAVPRPKPPKRGPRQVSYQHRPTPDRVARVRTGRTTRLATPGKCSLVLGGRCYCSRSCPATLTGVSN